MKTKMSDKPCNSLIWLANDFECGQRKMLSAIPVKRKDEEEKEKEVKMIIIVKQMIGVLRAIVT